MFIVVSYINNEICKLRKCLCVLFTIADNGYHILQKFLCLMLSMLGKNFSRQQSEIFFLIFQKKMGFDISCKLSPQETICMKCQCLFSGKNKKNIFNLLSAKFAQRVAKVKM